MLMGRRREGGCVQAARLERALARATEADERAAAAALFWAGESLRGSSARAALAAETRAAKARSRVDLSIVEGGWAGGWEWRGG